MEAKKTCLIRSQRRQGRVDAVEIKRQTIPSGSAEEIRIWVCFGVIAIMHLANLSSKLLVYVLGVEDPHILKLESLHNLRSNPRLGQVPQDHDCPHLTEELSGCLS